MANHTAGGVDFITDTPRIEIRKGVAKIIARSGDRALDDRAMEFSTFVRFIERGQRAIKRYTNGEEVIFIDD